MHLRELGQHYCAWARLEFTSIASLVLKCVVADKEFEAVIVTRDPRPKVVQQWGKRPLPWVLELRSFKASGLGCLT